MAQLSFVIIPSRVKSDGSHQIRLKITNVNTTAYVSTKYSIEKPTQLQNGMVVRHPQSKAINQGLRAIMADYESILSELPDSGLSASQIKKYFERPRFRGDSLKQFGQMYIDRLISENRLTYAKNLSDSLKYALDCFGEDCSMSALTRNHLMEWEKYLFKRGGAKKKNDSECNRMASPTTVNIRMTHLKALLNAAVNEGVVEYKVFPFRGYKMPTKNVRDICISKAELAKLRDAEFSGMSAKRLNVARDLFLLSFYCAGINLTDLLSAKLTEDVLTFVRKKTADKKMGADKEVSITIQPEAREIIDKYINVRGELDFGYKFSLYEQFRSFVTKSLNRIGEELKFEKKLMYYSARKTFVQFGSELGIPLYILEYAIGQTIKESNNRPVFNYLKIMRSQADLAIRTIIDYSFEPESEDEMPLPEWARRR